MSSKSQNNKIIFGLKVRQLRTERNLSFAELSEKTGMSLSYLNEIEKGKKYPKTDKIDLLAHALGTSPADLISEVMPKSLAPIEDLLQSNFLNELPLDLFGIEINKVVEIIANAPLRVGAFISTLVELSRNYALREENFYFAALRSYLELHNNYFEDLEEEVRSFVKEHKISAQKPLSASELADLLEKKFQYTIVDDGLKAYPELKNIRAVFNPRTKQLWLNTELNDMQKAFQFAKELGFNVLGLKERAYTSSLLRVKTFDEALNHFKAGYFSAALLMHRDSFVKDAETFLKMPKWDNGAFLGQLLDKYQATPEMLFQRLTNVLPRFLGLDKLFFLRIVHNLQTDQFEINKELHLNRRHQPHGNGLDEHYCRRWLSISSLRLIQQQKIGLQQPIIDVQISQYNATDDHYLCFTIAHQAGVKNISVTIGILIDAVSSAKIHFLNDLTSETRLVSTTCERCSVADCAERAVPPLVVERRTQRLKINESLKKILE